MSTDPVLEDTTDAKPYAAKRTLWWEVVIKTLMIIGMISWLVGLDDPGQSLRTVAGWTMVAKLLTPIFVVAFFWHVIDIRSRELQGLPARQGAILRSQWRWRWVSVVLLAGLSAMWAVFFIFNREAPQIAAAVLTALAGVFTAAELWRLRHHQVPDELVRQG
ncbi:hypothetical protein NBM05_01865 [Rothia sp. AR01]|uniref:Uncharacterized protein n=1 Tax=Rothia santali TaxID=2949643 RepID=A0A9X2KH38_9MICC|nr:hypothetical protein [Rothia santali]MCP3424808.1 hypothetical protein [Rothia santali]